MTFEAVEKSFRMVGMEARGEFSELGESVPALAKTMMERAAEVKHSTGIEIALFEAKRGEGHRTGRYVVGLMVEERQDAPSGMVYVEAGGKYVSGRAPIEKVADLHEKAVAWGGGHGFERNLSADIIEVYHALEDGEDVEIFLPVKG